MKEATEVAQANPEVIRRKVEALVSNFEADLRTGELRPKVLKLIPIFHELRKLGKALVPEEYALAAIDRILSYFRRYPNTVIRNDELMVISGIQEYGRRVRQLRVESGWQVASGVTIRAMLRDDAPEIPDELRGMKPTDYVLLSPDQDRDAAHRWHLANTIRKKKASVSNKILEFMRANVGKMVTGEELRYVASNKTGWPRRVRELRTEAGWPIVTKSSGRPDLPIGVYVLQADRQSPKHDRHIPDEVRGEVLRRDEYKCTDCSWSHEVWNPSDPRHLELHHIEEHAKGGSNDPDNLRTLCTICHDRIHRQ